MDNRKSFTQVYIEKEVKEFLKNEAIKDKRSLSSFINKILHEKVCEIKKVSH